MGKKLFFEKKKLLEEQNIYEDVQERTEESFMQYTRYSIKSEIKHTKQNGKKKTIENIDRIIRDTDLRTLVLNRVGDYKNIIDRIIDFGIKKKNAKMIYYILFVAYKVRR